MKKLFIASAMSCALAATTVSAGSYADPIIEAPVIVEEAESSSSGALIPILLFVVIAAALASNSGGAAGGGGASDVRLKTDIHQVGVTAHNLPLYHFKYIGSSQVYEGVMAQDVARVMPEAVLPFVFGYMAVDYDMLGIEMRKVQ